MNEREIARQLGGTGRPLVPQGLADRIKSEIPLQRSTEPIPVTEPDASLLRSVPRGWLAAASLVMAVGGAYVTLRLLDPAIPPVQSAAIRPPEQKADALESTLRVDDRDRGSRSASRGNTPDGPQSVSAVPQPAAAEKQDPPTVEENRVLGSLGERPSPQKLRGVVEGDEMRKRVIGGSSSSQPPGQERGGDLLDGALEGRVARTAMKEAAATGEAGADTVAQAAATERAQRGAQARSGTPSSVSSVEASAAGQSGFRLATETGPASGTTDPPVTRAPRVFYGTLAVDAQASDSELYLAAESAFIDTQDDSRSTLELPLGTGSYAVTRLRLNEGRLPRPEAIRVEEFVNSFYSGGDLGEESDVYIALEGAPSPYGESPPRHFLRVEVEAPTHLVAEGSFETTAVSDPIGAPAVGETGSRVEVEFNSEVVARYRRLGEGTRPQQEKALGEVRELEAPLRVIALYEVELRDDSPRRDPVATVRLHGIDGEGEVGGLRRVIHQADLSASWDGASASLRLASLAARFAEILRSDQATAQDLEDVLDRARRLLDELEGRSDVAEFVSLVAKARYLRSDAGGPVKP